jgi:hypothetical protein
MAKAFPTNSTGARRTAKTSVSSNQLTTVGETIAVTAGQLTLNALFGSIRVPKNAEIVSVGLSCTDIDTNGSPVVVLAIGDATVADRLMTGSVVGKAGGVDQAIALTGYGYQYTDETLVQVKVTTAPATAAAGTIKYHVAYVTN